MGQTDLTREQLVQRIAELELLNHELLAEKEQEVRLEYAWTGNLGHWYWHIGTNAVTFNPLKVAALGYAPDEVPEPVPYQFFTDRIHPDDYEHTMQAMRDHLAGQAAVYEVEYRIRAKDGTYRWYYDRGRITRRDANGKPLFLAGIVFDVTEKKNMQLDLERKNRILAKLSATDGLTQVSNHRTVLEYLKAAMVEADRTRSPLSVALFDIDDFKHVNDSQGHLVGDQVLVDVAALIKGNIRETDQIGRYGGESSWSCSPRRTWRRQPKQPNGSARLSRSTASKMICTSRSAAASAPIAAAVKPTSSAPRMLNCTKQNDKARTGSFSDEGDGHGTADGKRHDPRTIAANLGPLLSRLRDR